MISTNWLLAFSGCLCTVSLRIELFFCFCGACLTLDLLEYMSFLDKISSSPLVFKLDCTYKLI